jgi:hypothetical protein
MEWSACRQGLHSGAKVENQPPSVQPASPARSTRCEKDSRKRSKYHSKYATVRVRAVRCVWFVGNSACASQGVAARCGAFESSACAAHASVARGLITQTWFEAVGFYPSRRKTRTLFETPCVLYEANACAQTGVQRSRSACSNTCAVSTELFRTSVNDSSLPG